MWAHIKEVVKEMLDELYEGELEVKRLNYGIISLICMIKYANEIEQYGPFVC